MAQISVKVYSLGQTRRLVALCHGRAIVSEPETDDPYCKVFRTRIFGTDPGEWTTIWSDLTSWEIDLA